MSWYVYVEDHSQKTIVPVNLFEHGSFSEDVNKLLKRDIDFYDFSNQLNSTVMYYFWSRFEYEITISSYPPRDEYNARIDVYDQLSLNWVKFVNYVWSFSKSKFKKEVK